MVAGIKGVVFLSDKKIAATSSTDAEVFIISLESQSVERVIKLRYGERFKAEGLCVVPSEQTLLVCDASGHLCKVDLAPSPASITCVATHDFRLTSVVAVDARTYFVAGAVRGNKTQCAIWRVTDEITLVVEAPMVRALLVDEGRLVAGLIDVADEDAKNATTQVVSSDETESQLLGRVPFFVHAIAKHPRLPHTFALLSRHHKETAFDCPVHFVRFDGETGVALPLKCAIVATLPIGRDGVITRLTRHVVSGVVFGARVGREHAMAVGPDGLVVTGAVDKTTKGVLQVWDIAPLDDAPCHGES